ncbi:MAG: hypothetical protein DME79_09655 [Verrucomicrobia bacterium]|jgi:hypothetical protein|nr:MAG: hypothetical protein DME79_09655 [Verrucomicrobiota bacterium]PYJ53885.1 MAG: hypothetical protein DME82_12980 [Verrucomicrobiota bacterium]
MKEFFAELKRRNVYKVAVAHAVVGWLLMQVAMEICLLLRIPFLRRLRDDVRYKNLLAKLGLPIAS